MAQVAFSREQAQKMLRGDWDWNNTQLFEQLANKLPSPAGYVGEDTHRHMVAHPEETHGQLHHHWARGFSAIAMTKKSPGETPFSKTKKQHVLGHKLKEHRPPPTTTEQLSDRAKWRGGTHGLDGWRYRELRLLPNAIWELLATLFQALEQHEDSNWLSAHCWDSIPLLPN